MLPIIRVATCLIAVSIPVAWAEPPPRPVRVQTVHFQPGQESVTYAGTVQARVQASLGFRVAGKVTARAIDIGNHVTAGQALARLDPTDARLAVEADVHAVRAAEAEAVNARAEFQRYQKLGRGSPAYIASEYDRRRAAVDAAEARLAQAQRQLALTRDQLDYTELRADADGVITDLKLEPGQVVAAGQSVITLAHTAETEIVLDVPENRLPAIRAADSIEIRLWSQPDRALPGRVREIGALADPMSCTFAVKTASVRFGHSSEQRVARLAASAVVSVDGVPSVWVLDGATHRATVHPVTVAAWLGDGEVAIGGGVPEGAQVVTAGASQLDAATPVTAWAGAIR
jgi:multidrug efflux system membrane fusion protein